MGASKVIYGDIDPGGTITANVYTIGASPTLLNTSGTLTLSQVGANPFGFQTTMTDVATGTCKVILYRNGSPFAYYGVDFPVTDTAGSYEMQEIPTAAQNAAAAQQNEPVVNVVINPQQAIGSLTPQTIAITRGDRLTVTLPLLGTIAARTKLVVTCKSQNLIDQASNTDSQALWQVQEGVGLTVLNGATASVPSDASLVVNDASTGNVYLTMEGPATAVLPVGDYVYDVQWIGSNSPIPDPHTPISNQVCSVTGDVTQAVS